MIESNIDLESRAKAASKSTWISVVVNIFLSIGQILIGIFSKSQGLVADGIHTLSDLVADFIRIAVKPRGLARGYKAAIR